MSLMLEVVDDGFWMVLLVVAFTFLWFRAPNNRRIKHAEGTTEVRAFNKFSKHRKEAA